MKEKIVSLLLVLSLFVLSFAVLGSASLLTGCADTPSEDPGTDPGNEPGKEPEKEPEEDVLALIEDGEANFQFVYQSGLSAAVTTRLSELIKTLGDLGVTVKKQDDYHPKAVQDCEVLIGAQVANRPDNCHLDIHTLGDKGYTIRVIDSRILIAGGSDESLLEAMDIFEREYLGIRASTEELTEASVSLTLNLTVRQDDYRLTSVKVGSRDMADYQIYLPRTGSPIPQIAQELQAYLYSEAGVWLPIVTGAKAPESPTVRIEAVNDAGEEGFRVRVDESGNLLFECAYANAFATAAHTYIVNTILGTEGDLVFSADDVYTANVSTVHYKDFGATGNGITDDFDAIIAAHAYANAGGQKVCADKDATYYIGAGKRTAYVQTDTDWGNAKFIIDDREVPLTERGWAVFEVKKEYEMKYIDVPEGLTLKKGDTKIGMTFENDCLLQLTDKTHKVFIRYGANSNSGSNAMEVILVDRDGNIDPSTPVIWDYNEISTIRVIRTQDTPVTVQGGEFKTIVNKIPCQPTDGFYERGLHVSRPNTTVKNVKHYLEGEPTYNSKDYSQSCCPYTGFFFADFTNNVRFEDCVLTGHRTFKAVWPEGSANAGSVVSQGTYDTQTRYANAVTWYGCTQSNDIYDSSLWGIMASNFSKNLVYDHCKLSRYDAHQGVWNGAVLDTEIYTINCIGGGQFTVKNVKKRGSPLISLRTDYGATWEGDVSVENTTLTVTSGDSVLIAGNWTKHWFGYTCFLPQNVSINGLTVTGGTKTFYIFKISNTVKDCATNATNPYQPVKSLSIKGLVLDTPTTYNKFGGDESLFKDTKVTEE